MGWARSRRLLGRLPVTAELGLLAILIGLVIALPVGIYSAVRQYTAADYVGRSVAIMGLATPNFWLGTMVMIYPAIWWAWSPPSNYSGASHRPEAGVVMGETAVVSQELPTGPRPAWSWQKLR